MERERIIAFHWSFSDAIHRQTRLFVCLLVRLFIYLFYGLNVKFYSCFSFDLVILCLFIQLWLIRKRWNGDFSRPPSPFQLLSLFPIDMLFIQIFVVEQFAMTAVVITFGEKKSFHTIWFYGKSSFKIIMVLNVCIHIHIHIHWAWWVIQCHSSSYKHWSGELCTQCLNGIMCTGPTSGQIKKKLISELQSKI